MFRWFKIHLTPSAPSRRRSTRLQGVEGLESRVAPSGAPQVVDVVISNSSWSSSFVDELASQGYGYGGYSVYNNSSSIAWSGINTIKITFSENVNVDSSDLVVKGVDQSQYGISSFSYNSSTYTATWVLSGSVDSDRILLDLDGDGLDPVTDSSGTSMGYDFHKSISVMPGDVGKNGNTSGSDYVSIAQKIGASIGDSDYNVLYDLNGDGQINNSDLSVVGTHIGDSLPSGLPSSNDAPTILNFQATKLYGNQWRFSGDVFDPDDNVGSNYSVSFGGLLGGHSTSVDGDGSFVYETYVSQYGTVTATTQDPSGAYSDTASTSVTP